MINARSISTLGIGFGVLAVSTLGFIGSANIPEQVAQQVTIEAGNGGHARRKGKSEYWPFAAPPKQRFDIEADDNEIVEILTIMSTLL